MKKKLLVQLLSHIIVFVVLCLIFLVGDFSSYSHQELSSALEYVFTGLFMVAFVSLPAMIASLIISFFIQRKYTSIKLKYVVLASNIIFLIVTLGVFGYIIDGAFNSIG
jgi:hypothetical protein